MYKTSVYTLER